jgi:hypothetical protein
MAESSASFERRDNRLEGSDVNLRRFQSNVIAPDAENVRMQTGSGIVCSQMDAVSGPTFSSGQDRKKRLHPVLPKEEKQPCSRAERVPRQEAVSGQKFSPSPDMRSLCQNEAPAARAHGLVTVAFPEDTRVEGIFRWRDDE